MDMEKIQTGHVNIEEIIDMKKTIFYIICIIVTVSQFFFSSCSNEDLFGFKSNSSHSCKLILNGNINSFDKKTNTRVTTTNTTVWNDGDIVYLSFVVGANRIDGKAVYDKSEDDWTLYYNGDIYNGTSAKCDAYYFEGETIENGGKINIPTNVPLYTDSDASYSKTAEGMKVNVSLFPLTGRIRFKGTTNKEFHLSGINHYTSFDITKSELSNNNATFNMKVGTDGYTPYIYPFFPSVSSRKLVISYDNLSFSTECEHPILDAGQTGYMEIPAEEKHNGWNMIKLTLPSVATVEISEIGVSKVSFYSKLLDDGNGCVTDCGFCYSTSTNPTISDATISCGKNTGEFGKTITGLNENTTYYVRAYATTELGTAYSENVTFKTQEITEPVLSAVTTGTISNTSVELEATVLSIGNGTLRDAGFVYSTNQYPTLDENMISCGKNTVLKTTVQGLAPETKYYVRAYATNEKGTAYSTVKTFTTTKTVVNPYTVITVETSYGTVQFDMAKINGGTFTMGAQSTSSSQTNFDKNADRDEKPTHDVTLSSYYIGKTPVTQLLWYVVMGSYPNISNNYGRGDNYPVYNVTYTQCEQFIAKLNKLTKKNFRMPTEAEWEFAARGGNNSNKYKYSGSNTIGSVAWYNSNAGGKSHPVAQKEANEMNLYDMSGNVWEWCSDWYGNYTMSAQTNPKGPSSGTGKVIRGGGYDDSPTECRVSVRSNASTSSSLTTIGFRLIME